MLKSSTSKEYFWFSSSALSGRIISGFCQLKDKLINKGGAAVIVSTMAVIKLMMPKRISQPQFA